MITPAKINFRIYQGATFRQLLRWESETKTYAAISAISKTAPVVITLADALQAPPINWRCWVVGAGGMREINNGPDNYYIATKVTSNAVEINAVNAAQFTTYTSGGHLVYNAPALLNIFTSARLQIRRKITDTDPLLTLTTENAGIAIDDELKQVIVTITAEQSAQLDFTGAVYDLELIDNSGQVTRFAEGNVLLFDEVTR
jgi:hypothetical protein